MAMPLLGLGFNSRFKFDILIVQDNNTEICAAYIRKVNQDSRNRISDQWESFQDFLSQ